jgi:hypothetical protein
LRFSSLSGFTKLPFFMNKITQISSLLNFKLFILEYFRLPQKNKRIKMNRLIFGIFLGLITVVTAQYQPPYNRPQYQPQYQEPFGNIPTPPNFDDPCRRPGANCYSQGGGSIDTRERVDINGNRVRYTRICDDRGCYDRRNGSSALSINSLLMTICAAIAAAKLYLH